tara:strand:- start:273 stop:596 length:324 start_codon:yes stop_codon:yes gene_type:complete
MSWFNYGDQPSRRKRKGIWIREYGNPDIEKAIKTSGYKRASDTIRYIEVHELRPDNQVLLEVWCKSLLDSLRGKQRYNVFHIIVDENMDWICEGDLGRGLQLQKKDR